MSLHLVSLAAYPTLLNAGRSAGLSSGLRPGGAVGNFMLSGLALCFKTLECCVRALLAYHLRLFAAPLLLYLAAQLLHLLIAVQSLNFPIVQVFLIHKGV